jgi:hypothetical protein
LSLDNEGIVSYIEDLDKQTKAIKQEALRFSWHMRGGISYDDAMLLSQVEREIIGGIIKSNIETTKESGLPFF